MFGEGIGCHELKFLEEKFKVNLNIFFKLKFEFFYSIEITLKKNLIIKSFADKFFWKQIFYSIMSHNLWQHFMTLNILILLKKNLNFCLFFNWIKYRTWPSYNFDCSVRFDLKFIFWKKIWKFQLKIFWLFQMSIAHQ